MSIDTPYLNKGTKRTASGVIKSAVKVQSATETASNNGAASPREIAQVNIPQPPSVILTPSEVPGLPPDDVDEMFRRCQTQNRITACVAIWFTLIIVGLVFFFVIIYPILQQVNTNKQHSI